MKTAVIIPLYNGARWIRPTLDWLFRQREPAAEVVVVDDGSTDDSPDIVSRYPQVRLLRNPEKGANAARRFGMEHTESPVICFLDQDDLWHPDHLRLLTAWLERRPACRAIAATECDLNRQHPRPAWTVSDTTILRHCAWKVFPFGPRVGTPSAVAIRRSALEDIGGWPVEFPGLADYYTWLALSAGGSSDGGMALSRACTMARRRLTRSYSASLRSETSLLTYVGTLVRASAAAAERFGSRSPLDPDTITRRLRLARGLEQIIEAFLRRDWTAFSSAATETWERLAAEEGDLERKFGGMICWFLDSRRPGDEAIAVFEDVIRHWPKDNVFTLDLLRRRLALYRSEWARLRALSSENDPLPPTERPA